MWRLADSPCSFASSWQRAATIVSNTLSELLGIGDVAHRPYQIGFVFRNALSSCACNPSLAMIRNKRLCNPAHPGSRKKDPAQPAGDGFRALAGHAAQADRRLASP